MMLLIMMFNVASYRVRNRDGVSKQSVLTLTFPWFSSHFDIGPKEENFCSPKFEVTLAN
jgi:hypothetical protein